MRNQENHVSEDYGGKFQDLDSQSYYNEEAEGIIHDLIGVEGNVIKVIMTMPSIDVKRLFRLH